MTTCMLPANVGARPAERPSGCHQRHTHPRNSGHSTLWIPLLVYLVLVGVQGWRARDTFNPDAVSYLRNARYLAEGRLADAVSGYWSPLLSWCIAPLVYLGVDSLYAARIVLAGWGGLMVLACSVFLRRLSPCRRWLQIVILTLVAIIVARTAAHVITPDLLMFTLLTAYCAVVISPQVLEQKRTAAICGRWAPPPTSRSRTRCLSFWFILPSVWLCARRS